MKKNNKLIVVVVTILLLLVVGFIVMKKKGGPDTNFKNQETPKNLFTSVKDALSKNITLVCEFKDDSGMSTKSYIKNGAVRVSSTGQDVQTGEMVMKDKKMYMWDLKTKQGFVYDIPDSEDSSENLKSEAYLDMIDRNKDFCKVATVEDSYFIPPTDIKFQDMSKLLEDLQNQMPQIPQQ